MLKDRLSILLIDDQVDNLRFLSAILTQQGYKVRKAISGEMALETLQVEHPDLILLDIQMPQMDGYEICSILKATPATQDIPVIFLSALDSPMDKVKAFAVGGADYITKPFQAEEVLARIGHQLIIQQQQQQLKDQNQQLQLQMERERLIGMITQHIHESLELKEILHTTVKEVQQLLQTDWVMIQRLSRNSGSEIVAEALGSTYLPVLDWLIYEGGDWSELENDRETHVIEDIHNSNLSSPYTTILANFQIQASLMVPIIKGNDVWGQLIAHHCSVPRAWQAWEIDLLKQLAVQLAIAIQQSELYQHLQSVNQELKRLATTDGLTQIANRRYFDEYFDQEWQRLKREQQPLSLILCDVDYFKRYNDHYGHQAGDECLKQVAQAIDRVIKRPADLVARYGGEEFVVILPNTDLEGVFCVAEQIQAELANLQLPHAVSEVSDQVTLSMGVANAIPDVKYTAHCLIAIADWALYTAKAQGRNIICSREMCIAKRGVTKILNPREQPCRA
jgi:diguanylate cyclase (GGDEF)-like protein